MLVVGTTDEWESEGQDRSDMDLPGDQDALVEAVLDANPDTIVVVNAASPVTMPWADRARGDPDDAGSAARRWPARSPTCSPAPPTPAAGCPRRSRCGVEHNPSYGNFPGENGEVRYGEGVLMGYRWYDARHLPVRFPFGHGLSYATFEIGEPRVAAAASRRAAR